MVSIGREADEFMDGTAKQAPAKAGDQANAPAGPPYDDPMLQRLYATWSSKHRAGLLPARTDVDPLDFPELLPFIFLVDVERDGDGQRFRYRLLGTRLFDSLGEDATGKLVEETFPAHYAVEINAVYRQVAESGEPHCWAYTVPMAKRDHIRYRRLICPLASDGKTIDALIGVVSYQND